MTDDQLKLLTRLCDRPSMYVGKNDFPSVCAYIDGLHSANRCLIGFREWLVVRAGTGSNLVWHGLVSLLLKNESVPESEKVARLGELIREFHEFTGPTQGASTGLLRVYVRYHGWLLQQSWYKPNRPDYIAPHDGMPGDGDA